MELLRVELEIDPALIVDPAGHDIILDELRRLAGQALQRDDRSRILANVAAEHGVTVDDLKGPSRQAAMTSARHAAMAALMDAGLSSVRVGRLLGRDHTTVLAGVKRHRQRLAAKADVKLCDHVRCGEVAMAGGRWCLAHFHAHVDQARRRRQESAAKAGRASARASKEVAA